VDGAALANTNPKHGGEVLQVNMEAGLYTKRMRRQNTTLKKRPDLKFGSAFPSKPLRVATNWTINTLFNQFGL
jgi:hypothetical protein